MAKRFVRILEDIEEALQREVRKITFMQQRQRTPKEGVFKEMFDWKTGELVRQPIEARFYDDSADSLVSTSPRVTISLLKLYEDLETKRQLPTAFPEDVCVINGPKAYQTILGNHQVKTTDGGSDSDIQLTDRKIRQITTDHWVRILSGNNQGTYQIDSISLNGNGPHTITLSNTLLSDLPVFRYNISAGIIVFTEFVDLTVVKAGDSIVDAASNSFVITAVNAQDSSLAIAPGSNMVNGAGASVTRTGDVLQNDDSDADVSALILDPAQPLAGLGTRYERKTFPTPYTFLYYIKIASRERDDHIAIADRMMEVFNPPRGQLFVITRMDTSAETELISDVAAGSRTVLVKDAKCFYVNETVRLFHNVSLGEELTVESVNPTSNSVTFTTPLANSYSVNDCSKIVSNSMLCVLERDFRNHETEDKIDEQFWIHRFTYRIEGWIESRIAPYETEQVSEEIGDVNFARMCIEDFDENLQCELLVP